MLQHFGEGGDAAPSPQAFPGICGPTWSMWRLASMTTYDGHPHTMSEEYVALELALIYVSVEHLGEPGGDTVGG